MKLAQFLHEKKLTQAEFANKLGITQQAVSQWINGTRPQYPYMLSVHDVTKGKVSFRDWV